MKGVLQSPYKCPGHGEWLIPAVMKLGKNPLRYFKCPIKGCDYAKANKWTEKNRKRSS